MVGFINGRDGEPHWELLDERKRAKKRIDQLKYKDGKEGKVNELKIDQTVKVIAIKNRDNLYYASDYPMRTLAIKNQLNGKIMLVTTSFKFVNKKGGGNNNKTKEQGIIRNV